MSYDSWINIYSFAESIARIFYFIILPAQLFSSKITSSGGKRILTGVLNYFGLVIWIFYVSALERKFDPKLDGQINPLPFFFLMMASSFCFELGIHCFFNKQTRLSITGLCNWRLMCFLIWLGANSMVNYYVVLKHYDYEYYGPMRITKVATHYMSELFREDNETFHCLKDMPSNSYHSIRPTLQIEWGYSWGCENKTEKWNTNWPSWMKCAKLICPVDDDDNAKLIPSPSPCTCYKDRNIANQSSWECLHSEFNLSKLDDSFDRNQPPWEDPLWPSLSRYGNCDLNVGTSMDPIYVHNAMNNAKCQYHVGSVCVLMGFAMMVMLVGRLRQQLLRQ